MKNECGIIADYFTFRMYKYLLKVLPYIHGRKLLTCIFCLVL